MRIRIKKSLTEKELAEVAETARVAAKIGHHAAPNSETVGRVLSGNCIVSHPVDSAILAELRQRGFIE